MGAIIIGYQGIGKTTLAMSNSHIVDLESSAFWYNGVRPDDWYIYYCQMAKHLADGGHTVFVSSHAVVREFLLENFPLYTYAVAPDITLKDQWLKRLKRRYESTNVNECNKVYKNYNAYMGALHYYDENIYDIIHDMGEVDPRKLYLLKTSDYDLQKIVDWFEYLRWVVPYSEIEYL